MRAYLRNLSSINAVCPYYTMYPLDFPLRVLRNAVRGDWVLDPFCGRGTTQFAARLGGLGSIGLDSSPVAVAIARAKLPFVDPSRIVRLAKRILEADVEPRDIPKGKFWRQAFHPEVLTAICRLREAFLQNCRSDARSVLRAIVLGALHGPIQKRIPSYFSNQCPRTFSPKPRYAMKFWSRHKLLPPKVDVLQVIERRAVRFLHDQPKEGRGRTLLADSRRSSNFNFDTDVAWVVTSPPYYGMRTYFSDQWIRGWFLGTPPKVQYAHSRFQVDHKSPEVFTSQLAKVWTNATTVCGDDARLVCRFGGIRDRKADPLDLILDSLRRSPWRITTIHPAGTSLDGRRQASQFFASESPPLVEYDVCARLS
jgi:hypothetical protein